MHIFQKWMRLSTKAAPIAALAVFASISLSHAVEIAKPRAVIELFTSQGCSSCPPADAALKEFNATDDILGLALHVDYWDRLGWADTFASPENTKRQWRYARSLGERQVYTPQAIVNGRTHLVGSRKTKIEKTVEDFANSENGLTIPIDISQAGGSLNITIPSNSISKHATLYAFYFNPGAEVVIKRGENAGQTLKYSNIVRKVEMIGMVGGQELSTSFSLADLRNKGYKGCALILQESTKDGNPGAILGASVISDL